MLTDTACRNTKPGEKIKKLAESGLQLWIFPNGSRLWRFAYAIRGKQKLLALGAYPQVSLLDARNPMRIMTKSPCFKRERVVSDSTAWACSSARPLRRNRRLPILRSLAKYLRMSKVFKALSDPTRRKVLELLRKAPMTAGELADHFPVSRPTMSAHFAVLKDADLVAATKSGQTVIYQLKLSVLEDALLAFAQTFGLGLGGAPTSSEADNPIEKEARTP
jgi:DNA-binding transcriptional ArsR family regulator